METHKNTAKNFFFYFLTFVLLYIVAINLGGVLFNIINRILPLVGSYDDGGSLRFNLSSLIIGTPIFLWLSKKVYREAATDEMLRNSGIRRWLTYITLIAAALIVIGDLIALVNNLLGGETTTRFILKALVVLVIAGAIFYYYLNDVRGMRDGVSSIKALPHFYFISTGVVALIVIIAGFFFIESPIQQRLRRQDDARINNLQQIENGIYQYVSTHDGKLPESLATLTLQEGVTSDPVTHEQFQFTIVDATSFKLCATFETSNREKTPNEPTSYYSPEWLHEKGLVCFDRSTDQILNQGNYPTKPVPVAY